VVNNQNIISVFNSIIQLNTAGQLFTAALFSVRRAWCEARGV
jgi:hypothetical protein